MTCNQTTLKRMTLLASLTAMVATLAVADDWPQWRGPNRDGAVTAFSAPSSWPASLTELWKVDVGMGYATPLLVGDRIYMFTRQGGDEVMMALEAATGDVIWRTAYPAPFEMNPATSQHGPGPKSTPAFADNRLFTLGMSGLVTAFDATTGRQLWQHPAPPAHPQFHTAMSPVVDGDLVIVHIGGEGAGALTAFDAASGEVRWSWDGDSPAYGSPMIFELGGTRQVVTFTHQHLVGVSLATGELLWSRPFETRSNTTSQTPILYNNMVIQAGRGNGITAFRVVRNGSAWSTEDVWHTDEVSLHMANAVAIDGVLYGLSHLNSGQYFGLDLDAGKVLWTSDPRQAENAAIVRAGDTVFSLQNDAQLVVFRASRNGFEVLQRYEVASSATWTQPTLFDDKVFVKDVSTLALLSFD